MESSSKLQYVSYSEVLFDYAVKADKVKFYFELCSKLLDVLKRDNDTLFMFLKNNSIDKNERKEVIDLIFKENADEFFVYFLYTVIDFNRGSILIKIIKHFLKLCDEHYNIRYIRVFSPYSLNKQQLNKLSVALARYYNSKVHLDNIVDASLIGGIKVVSDSDSIDDTFKAKLSALKQDSQELLSRITIEGEHKND